jgi:cytochrome c
MSVSDRLPSLAVAAVVLAGAGVMAWNFFGTSGSAAVVDVRVPALSAQATSGEAAFNENCVACHGDNASGSDQGPPLIHNIYNPGHHADAAFFMAASRGVRAHHWPYGSMPPQPQVSRNQMIDIVRYIRELQAANGITYKPHRM